MLALELTVNEARRLRREVLTKEQFHVATIRRRSRSAAKDSQACIRSGQIGKFIQHFSCGHTPARVIEHIGDSHTGAVNTGFATAHERVNGNAFPIIHGRKVRFAACLEVRAERGLPPTIETQQVEVAV